MSTEQNNAPDFRSRIIGTLKIGAEIGEHGIPAADFDYIADLALRCGPPTPSLPASPELPESVQWTQTPPTEQNWYWHWNGNDDCAPLPMSVLYSGTTGKCFVSSGQLSIEHAIDCDQYGGWWKPMVTPLTPTQLELAAIRAAATPSPVAGLPTPETDEEEKKPYPFSTNLTKYRGMRNLARSLERRLAAARAEVGELVEHNNLCNNSVAEASLAFPNVGSYIAQLEAQIATAKEERDEAKAAVPEGYAVAKDSLPHQVKLMASGLHAFHEEITSLRSDLAKANAAVEELKKKQPINTHRRLFDLVRNCRAQLHEEDLITDDEYAWLCTHEFPEDKGKSGSPSPRRLEDYDDLRAQLAAQQSVPPEARAVEAENILTAQLALPPDKRDWNEVHRAALSLRTVVPPGEGEEWANHASVEIFRLATKEAENGMMPDKSDMRKIILKHAPARPTAAREDTRNLPIDESNLLLLGFIKGEFFNGVQYWEWVVTIEDCSHREWARIVVCRGNGSDPDCWDIRFHRQDGNNFRPLDRVTLKYGARKMGELIDLINAIDYKRPAAIDAAMQQGGKTP